MSQCDDGVVVLCVVIELPSSYAELNAVFDVYDVTLSGHINYRELVKSVDRQVSAVYLSLFARVHKNKITHSRWTDKQTDTETDRQYYTVTFLFPCTLFMHNKRRVVLIIIINGETFENIIQ